MAQYWLNNGQYSQIPAQYSQITANTAKYRPNTAQYCQYCQYCPYPYPTHTPLPIHVPHTPLPGTTPPHTYPHPVTSCYRPPRSRVPELFTRLLSFWRPRTMSTSPCPYSRTSLKVTKPDCVATRVWRFDCFDTVLLTFLLFSRFWRLFGLGSIKWVLRLGVWVYN